MAGFFLVWDFGWVFGVELVDGVADGLPAGLADSLAEGDPLGEADALEKAGELAGPAEDDAAPAG